MNHSPHNFNVFTEWRTQGLREEDGILIGCNDEFETLLLLWLHNYSKYNAFPLAIANFGLSEKMLKWCSEKGEIINVSLPRELFDKRMRHAIFEEHLSKKYVRHKVLSWYKKPFALLQSPFKRTLWIDIDTIVLGNLAEAFNYATPPFDLAMGVEASEDKVKRKVMEGILNPGDTLFNAGVIAFNYKSEIVKLWAEEIINREGRFVGDSDLFSRVVGERCIDIPILPNKFNWLVADLGINREAAILHFAGKAKDLLLVLVDDFYRYRGRSG